MAVLKVCLMSDFRVDNNHLLLLMIHVFRENEEQLFKVKTAFYMVILLLCLGLFRLLLHGSVTSVPFTF